MGTHLGKDRDGKMESLLRYKGSTIKTWGIKVTEIQTYQDPAELN